MQENKESILTGVLSISGKPGLFKTISQGGTKLIAESLTDGKRNIVHSSSQVISLSDVSIYGEDEEMPLEDIFKTMLRIENKQKSSVTPKDSNADLNAYFGDIFPDFDKERVYPSDIKKVIRWYNLLLSKDMLNFDEAATEEVVTEEKAEEAAE